VLGDVPKHTERLDERCSHSPKETSLSRSTGGWPALGCFY
jgi:hypothetical protein